VGEWDRGIEGYIYIYIDGRKSSGGVSVMGWREWGGGVDFGGSMG